MKHEISPMLENAFERRFCYSQLGVDVSNFEAQHSDRVEQCIKYLDDFFSRHQTNIPETDSLNDARDLIGLAHDNLNTAMEFCKVTPAPPPRHIPDPKTNWLSIDTVQINPSLLVPDDIDSGAFSENEHLSIDALRQLSTRYRLGAYFTGSAPRLQRGVRMRKEPLSAKITKRNSKAKKWRPTTYEHNGTKSDTDLIIRSSDLTAKAA